MAEENFLTKALRIIGEELPKFASEMNVPFSKDRGSVFDKPTVGDTEKALGEALLQIAGAFGPAALTLPAKVSIPTGIAAATGDPTALIPGVGAGLMTASGDAEAAFRPSNSSLLPSLRKALEGLVIDGVQFSKKDIAQYGAPEFKLDEYLLSTTNPMEEIIPVVRDLPKALNIRDNILQNVKYRTEDLLNNMDSINGSSYYMFEGEKVLKKGKDIQMDIEYLRKATSPTYTVYQKGHPIDQAAAAVRDLGKAAYEFSKEADRLGVKIEGRPLQNIKADVDKAKVIETLNQVKVPDVIKARTQVLEADPERVTYVRGSEGGKAPFVELREPLDLAQETAILKHCVGSCRSGNGWIPALDPITGKPHKDYVPGTSIIDIYKQGIAAGEKIYSYRPEGLPEFTVHVVDGGVQQAYGLADARLTVRQKGQLEEFLRVKNLRDPFGFTQ